MADTHTYRITVQKLDATGQPGELVEIMEMKRPTPWTTVFDFVDQYRREVAAEEAEHTPC